MRAPESIPKTDPAAGQRGLPHLSGLDGIRGLAALAVVLFHAGVWWLPAGFLGVDVFFVVSGFLITSLLISERERSGNTDLAQFWLRRARRLLPVLVLVLIVTTVYAVLVLQETLSQHLHEVLMAALYVTTGTRSSAEFRTSRCSSGRHSCGTSGHSPSRSSSTSSGRSCSRWCCDC